MGKTFQSGFLFYPRAYFISVPSNRPNESGTLKRFSNKPHHFKPHMLLFNGPDILYYPYVDPHLHQSFNNTMILTNEVGAALYLEYGGNWCMSLYFYVYLFYSDLLTPSQISVYPTNVLFVYAERWSPWNPGYHICFLLVEGCQLYDK